MNQQDDFTPYLADDAVIDLHHPAIRAQAEVLTEGARDASERAQRCYLFVRDAIDHSFDVNASDVTCSASAVLHAGHGICYAKSHLLAALLRSNGIPAGFSYQRLADDEGGFVLHGYNTLYLPEHGWFGVDARGNTGDIDAQFIPPQQRLAFSTEAPGEVDYGLNLASPLPCVVRALMNSSSTEQLRRILPTSVRMG